MGGLLGGGKYFRTFILAAWPPASAAVSPRVARSTFFICRDAIDICQAKRRGCRKADPIRVTYEEDGTDGAILLKGGPVDEGDLEKISEAIVAYLAGREEGRTGEIEAAVPKNPAVSRTAHHKAVGRALKELVSAGTVLKRRQGVYKLIDPPGEEGPDESY